MIVVLLQEWKLWEAYINSCSQSTVNSTDEGILETGNIFQCHDSWDTSVLVERLIARTYDSVGPATSLETGQRYVYLPLSGFSQRRDYLHLELQQLFGQSMEQLC
jgi:hypothetical protein